MFSVYTEHSVWHILWKCVAIASCQPVHNNHKPAVALLPTNQTIAGWRGQPDCSDCRPRSFCLISLLEFSCIPAPCRPTYWTPSTGLPADHLACSNDEGSSYCPFLCRTGLGTTTTSEDCQPPCTACNTTTYNGVARTAMPLNVCIAILQKTPHKHQDA